MNDAQAVQQVLAELSGRDQLGQVPVRRRNHANVDAGAGASEPTAWISPFSRKRSSIACMRRLISPTSSRKSVPRCASLQLPKLVAIGASEAALHVSEELGLEQRFGQAGAVDGDKRVTWRAATVAWNVTRDQIFADAAFTGDEHFAFGAAARSAAAISAAIGALATMRRRQLAPGKESLDIAMHSARHRRLSQSSR